MHLLISVSSDPFKRTRVSMFLGFRTLQRVTAAAQEQCRGIVDEASALDEELAAVHSRLEQQLLTKLEQEEQIR